MVHMLWKWLHCFFFKKVNLELYYPALPIFSIDSKELKIHVHIKNCTQIFTEALT